MCIIFVMLSSVCPSTYCPSLYSTIQTMVPSALLVTRNTEPSLKLYPPSFKFEMSSGLIFPDFS